MLLCPAVAVVAGLGALLPPPGGCCYRGDLRPVCAVCVGLKIAPARNAAVIPFVGARHPAPRGVDSQHCRGDRHNGNAPGPHHMTGVSSFKTGVLNLNLNSQF